MHNLWISENVEYIFCGNVDNFEDTIFGVKKFYFSRYCIEYLCEISLIIHVIHILGWISCG